ncbi:MAG: radical SAM protein [Thermoplasmatales archaeon]|nr:MAG: radical SAM protein [Thermoplasmatales archaeon]
MKKLEERGDASLYLEELRECRLCSWECGINRLEGERGVCGISIPMVASSMLHPAPPASYDAFLVGCSFRCLFCQNWRISNYPENPCSYDIEGYYPPRKWAELAVKSLKSSSARLIGADRLFFTGGEPTCSLSWVEEVVKETRTIDKSVKVNYDTNGFLTKKSLKRVLDLATSITYDIKAYSEKIHQALTGAPVEQVLQNAEYIGKKAKEKLWEFRVMVIPQIHEKEIQPLCEFIASIDTTLPVCFLAYRPNFVMAPYSGATSEFMDWCINTAKKTGIENVHWSGTVGIKGEKPKDEGIYLAYTYAKKGGCIQTSSRYCKTCVNMHKCKVKKHIPLRST